MRMGRMFWDDLKAEPQPHQLLKLPFVGKQQEEAPHSPLPHLPSGSGLQVLRLLRPPGTDQRPRAPAPALSQAAVPPKEGSCPELHFTPANAFVPRWLRTKPTSLCCSLCTWELGQLDAGDTAGSLGEAAELLPATHCHCGGSLPQPADGPSTPSTCWQPLPAVSDGRAGQGQPEGRLGPQPPFSEADKPPASESTG